LDFFSRNPQRNQTNGKRGNFLEHIKIKKARKSLIYTLLEVFGKPAGGGSGK
jgi:hypothetical protein